MGHLTLEQRYTIQVLLKEGLNQSLIAKRLNRDKSVIQREIKRNCDLRSREYKAVLAYKKCSFKCMPIKFISKTQSCIINNFIIG
jgi:IS30 family transposase